MPGMTKPWDPSLVRKTERQRLMEREVKGGGRERDFAICAKA